MPNTLLTGLRSADLFMPSKFIVEDQFWHNEQIGGGLGAGWTDWHVLSQAGDRAKSLFIVQQADGRLHAFMIGMDDQLWHNEQSGGGLGAGWTGWHVLSQAGDRAKSLVVAQQADGRLHAFATGESPWITTAEMHTEPVFNPNTLDRTIGTYMPGGGGRWYPMLLTLADGSVLAMSGHPAVSDTRHSNWILEVYHPSTGIWSDEGDEPPGVKNAIFDMGQPEIYPRLHLLPDGRVFCVSLAHTIQNPSWSWIWDPASKTWVNIASGPYPSQVDYPTNLSSSVLLPLQPQDGYRARILFAGGAPPQIIEPITDPHPSWNPTQPREQPAPVRDYACLVLLPDATVLMVGGTADQNDDTQAVKVAEQYNPATGQWKTLAAATVPRQYHSTALLLPDATVWTAGSNIDFTNTVEHRMEIYSPPYLFRGPRPTIDSAPEILTLPSSITIATPDANNIQSVALIRCGTSTHAFDSDQRYVALAIQSQTAANIVVTSPPNHNIAPPGYYLLFIVSNAGVPSIGRFIHIQ